MHSTERTRPEPTESEKKENKPNAAKILQAEKLDVSQQTKNKCRRKTRFLETNQKNLAKENESGMAFILYVVFSFHEENFVHFTFHIFRPEMFSSALNTLSEFHIGPEKQF